MVGCIWGRHRSFGHHSVLHQSSPQGMGVLDYLYDTTNNVNDSDPRHTQLDFLPLLVHLLSNHLKNSWAALAAALSSTFNALRFCGSTSNIKNAYIASTPFPLPSVINYLNGLGIACRCVYAAIAFAVAVW